MKNEGKFLTTKEREVATGVLIVLCFYMKIYKKKLDV